MKLSDGTIINERIKFLGVVYAERDGCSFTFNSHKMRARTYEEAETLRKEIEDTVPHVEMPKAKDGLDKTAERLAKFDEPPLDSSGNAI